MPKQKRNIAFLIAMLKKTWSKNVALVAMIEANPPLPIDAKRNIRTLQNLAGAAVSEDLPRKAAPGIGLVYGCLAEGPALHFFWHGHEPHPAWLRSKQGVTG